MGHKANTALRCSFLHSLEVLFMNLNQFLYFKTIVQANSIVLASERLFITPQALSKSIKLLEQELGASLFSRTNRGIILTKDGEYVLQIADKMLGLMHDLKHYFRSQSPVDISGTICIMSPPHISEQFLAKTTSYFIKNYPDVSLNITEGTETQILSCLSKKKIDIGIFLRMYFNGKPLLNIEPPLTFVPTSKYYYFATIHKENILSKLPSVSLEQLSEYPAVIDIQSTIDDSFVYKILKQSGAKKFYPTHSVALFYQLLSDNLAISLHPYTPSNIEIVPSDCVQIPVENDLYAILGYAYNKDYCNNALSKIFLDEFSNQF